MIAVGWVSCRKGKRRRRNLTRDYESSTWTDTDCSTIYDHQEETNEAQQHTVAEHRTSSTQATSYGVKVPVFFGQVIGVGSNQKRTSAFEKPGGR